MLTVKSSLSRLEVIVLKISAYLAKTGKFEAFQGGVRISVEISLIDSVKIVSIYVFIAN